MLTQQCGDCSGCLICDEASTLPYTGDPTTTVRALRCIRGILFGRYVTCLSVSVCVCVCVVVACCVVSDHCLVPGRVRPTGQPHIVRRASRNDATGNGSFAVFDVDLRGGGCGSVRCGPRAVPTCWCLKTTRPC